MQVILLNHDYSYLNSISVRRALGLIAKGKVTVEKYSEKIVRTVTKEKEKLYAISADRHGVYQEISRQYRRL